MSTQQLGGWLKHEREARGLTVEAIASQTKIPPRHLEALERGDGWALPAFYQRAEVRAVARVVGVDEQVALARLDTELAPVEPPPAPSRRPPLRSQLVVAIIGTAVVVAGLAGWSSYARMAASEGVKTPAPITASRVAPTPSEVPGAGAVETAAALDATPLAPASPIELVIRTQPEGARVTVNGISRGASPVTIRHLEPGEKRIRVTMDGYTAIERSVTIDEGRRETIRIRLSSVGAGS
jgi:cytoskeletal protein RodZ